MFRILIVDDERIVLNGVRMMIEEDLNLSFSTDIALASNGPQALELLQHFTPDLILTDIRMPVMDGIEALKEIRRHTAELPVIMQTAYAFDTDRRTAEEAGCNGFITKPVMPRELKMYLDKYLIK